MSTTIMNDSETGEIITTTIVGDLKITKIIGGNWKHKGFWHKFNCYPIHSESETIPCSPPIRTDATYFKCGHYEKTRRERVKHGQS